MNKKDPEKLTILIRVPSEIEAAPIVAALESQGISSTVTGGFTAGFIAEAPGDVQIKILEKDRKIAQKVLRQFQADNQKINWDQVDVGKADDD